MLNKPMKGRLSILHASAYHGSLNVLSLDFIKNDDQEAHHQRKSAAHLLRMSSKSWSEEELKKIDTLVQKYCRGDFLNKADDTEQTPLDIDSVYCKSPERAEIDKNI